MRKYQFLSYGKQSIDEEDELAVLETLCSDYLTQGPKVVEFENAICDYTGVKYCVAVSNGTAALHIAVAALEIGPHFEGITSPITFVASSNALIYNRLRPVFADIDENTYNLDPDKTAIVLSEKTRLIIPIHFAGQAADMDSFSKLAQNHSLHIIEDASHALGSFYKDGSKVGNCKYSDMTTFSFHPVKTITTGEGGAITTNSKELYEKLFFLRSHGITSDPFRLIENPGPWYYEMQMLGFNYRMCDIQAALGVSQMKKLDSFMNRRRTIIQKYNRSFANIDWLRIPYESKGLISCFHLYVVQIDFERIGLDRKIVMTSLREKNVGTQVHYIPVHTQPYYRQNYGTAVGDFPIAENYYNKCLSLPLFPAMTDQDVEYVIETVRGLR